MALSTQDNIAFRRRDDELARILCYLIEQFGMTPFDRTLLRDGVDTELVRRRRDQWTDAKSNQPLYYAIRAYVERCLEDTKRFVEAKGDISLFKEVLSDLDKEPRYREERDIRGQIARFVSNIEQLEAKTALEASAGPLEAAKIAAEANKWGVKRTARTAVVTAVIGLAGIVAVALIGRIPRGRTAPAATPAVPTPGSAPQGRPPQAGATQAAPQVSTPPSAGSKP